MTIPKHTTDDNQPTIDSLRQGNLAAFGHRALTAVDFSQLAREASELAITDLGVEHCDVLELVSDGMLRLHTAMDGRLDDELSSILLTEGTAAAQVLQTHCAVIVDEQRSEPRFVTPPWQRERGVVSTAIVPLLGPLQPIGILEIGASHRRIFSGDDVNYLQILAHLLSGAMQRIALLQQKRDYKMRRAEQMMAIGQVAAGVAHELRNPLTSIKGLVQVNLRDAKLGGLPTDDLAVIEHEIRRMERTLQTFLDFARPPQPDRRPLLLNNVVHRVFALVNGRARKQAVTLRRQLQPKVIVNADEDQIQQLLLNLVLNALDAMPDGGTIQVKVSASRDGQVELAVDDTGPGIAAHILPSVFETFVSSKETGVGLGLPVSQRIAEDHGGTLSAYNKPGGGACFVLRLPAAS